VTVGETGKASLSQVSVEVYDGSRRVAAKTLRHPD